MVARATRRMLVVLAHPDDEVTVGGTIARYASQGVEVSLVCTTNGGGGLGASRLSAQELMEMRKAELQEAASILGVARLELLEELSPSAEPLRRGNYPAVIEQHREWVAELMEELQPQVVLTFGPDGITGHETHAMVGELTAEAVRQVDGNIELYQVAMSEGQRAEIMDWIEGHPEILKDYQEEQRLNPAVGSPVPTFITSDGRITTSIDISGWIELKREAIAAHKSQGGGGGILDAFGVPEVEHFAAVPPAAAVDDLFGSA